MVKRNLITGWMAGMLLPGLLAPPSTAAVPADEPLRVAAAASLREALSAMAEEFTRAGGGEVELTFGSSGQLLAQIRNGAALDVFISAAHSEIDALARDGLIVPASRRIVAANALVLIAPVEARAGITRFEDLPRPALRRLAIGAPATVPAGRYAQQVLSALRLEAALAGRIVHATNVRQVLDYVERGEVDAGIVYASDARSAGDRVRIVAIADPRWHQPIEYPAVVLRAAKSSAAAERFVQFVQRPESRQVFDRLGFGAVDSGAGPAVTARLLADSARGAAAQAGSTP